MRARGTLALLLLLGGACRSDKEPPRPAPPCDLNALTKLAEHLDTVSPGQGGQDTWGELQTVCGDALPNMAEHAYDLVTIDGERGRAPKLDTNSRTLQLDACPNWLEVEAALAEVPSEEHALRVFQACKFDRFGVFDEHELPQAPYSMLTTWSLHAWFLDQGLAPEPARSISRELYGLELRNALLGMAYLDLKLPLAEGSPVPSGLPLVLTSTAIRLGGQRIADLQEGRPPSSTPEGLIRPLYEALRKATKGGEDMPVLLLLADASTRFDALRGVVYTAERAGLERFALLVRTRGKLGYTQLPLHASGRWPRGEPNAPTDERPHLNIELSGREDDLAELETRAKAFLRANPDSTRALVSAAPKIQLARLVLTLQALRASELDELVLVEAPDAQRPQR